MRPLDPAAAPGYAEVVETLVRVGFDRRIGDAPVLVTLPAPSTVAARLGGGRLAAHLREWPGLVGDALGALAETQIRFAELCLAEGLAGVLYTVHVPAEPALGPSTYAEMLEPHDQRSPDRPRRPVRAVRGATSPGWCPSRGWADWPADVDRLGGRSRHAGTRRRARPAPGAALGGLDAQALRDEPPATAVQAAQAALAAAAGRGLVVGPAGPVWPDTPDEVLAAVVRALEVRPGRSSASAADRQSSRPSQSARSTRRAIRVT